MIPLPLLCCFVLASCTALVSDQCRSVTVLLSQANKVHDPAPLLFLASQQGHLDALSLLHQYASQNKHSHWLKLAADLGAAQSQYQLAMELDDPQQQQSYMDKAAQQGYPPAQYEMSLLAGQDKVKLIWLEKSARQNYLSAQIGLYQWWLLQQDFSQAMPWLIMAAQRDGASAIILAKQQWRSGAYKDAIDSFKQATSLGEAEGSVYLDHIEQYWSADTDADASGNNAAKGKLLVQRPNCVMRLQFIATSLDSAVQATRLIRQFDHDQSLQSLPICINTPILLQQNRLNCKANWASSQRISCDVGALAVVAKQAEFSHAVVLAKQGKANVHNGLMYLDLADTYQVFIHELAHFAGFVDEYPISAKMADNVCTDNTAANLLFVAHSASEFAGTEADAEVSDVSEVSEVSDVSEISEVSPELTKSRTCDNHSAQAFKLSADLTFMEFYDRPVPREYVDIWQQRLESRTALLPVYVNIAQHFENKQNYPEAEMWWNKYWAYLTGTTN